MKKSFFLVFILIEFSIAQEQNKIESDLLRSLLSNYSKLMRPSDKVYVVVNIQLKQIIGVDEKNQLLTTLAYLHMSWKDPRLVWDELTNNESITIKANDVWIPDLTVTNTADSNSFFNLNDNFMVNLIFNGTVTFYLRLAGLKTRCDVNIKKVCENGC